MAFKPSFRALASAAGFACLAWNSTAFAASYQSTVLADNPMAYYRFEELAGPTAANLGSLGAPANGIFTNVATTPSSQPGLGRTGQFNGNGAVTIPDVAGFNLGTGPFSVELWYATGAGGRGDLFTYKGAGGDYGLHSNSQGAPGGFNGSASTFFNGFVGQVGANLNQWHHLVATRGAGGTYRMYVDGVLGSTSVSNSTWNIANNLLIGSNHSGNPVNLAIPFNGQIDEVAIYNQELTQAQVSAHRAAGLGVAKSIGLSFVGGNGPGNGQNRTLGALQIAGVVPQAHWNNAAGVDGAAANLIADNGLPTLVGATWDGDGTFSTGNGSGTPNHILMNGYVDDFNNSTSTYTVSNIPFNNYHVYVYTDSDAADSRDESFTITDGIQTLGPVFVSDESNFSGTFVRATATSLNGVGAQGNYVLFENLSGDSFTITGQ